MGRPAESRRALPPRVAVSLAALLWLAAAGCGGGGTLFSGSGGPATSGSVTLTLSDPATCGAPNGPYSHIWLSVADVQASPNANASAGDPSFVDLTPSLRAAPKQVDLLATPTQCVLATLAANASIPAGKYAQIRVFPAPDSAAAAVAANACGNAANCAQLASNGAIVPITLGAEAANGIALAGPALANGGFTVAAGQAVTVNIAWDGCASLVASGGALSLNPALSGGTILPGDNSISGNLVDALSGSPIGGRGVVSLEQNDSAAGGNGVDRVLLSTLADASGNFTLCPVPAGNYDLVAAAATSAGGQYAPTLLAGVPAGASLGALALYAGVGVNANPGTAQLAATSAGGGVDLRVSALASIPRGTQTFVITVPLPQQPAATLSLATASGPSCSAAACASALIALPALNASFAQFQPSGALHVVANTTTPALYSFDFQAFAPGSGGQPDCSPAEQTSGVIAIAPNGAVTPPAIAFSNCH